MDKYIGTRLDHRYLVQELLGVGGMANVYKAVDETSGRDVAIKILREEYVENSDLLRRFKNESKAVSMLSHPNIVKVYDLNFTESVNYIVMEFIDGVTLKEYIEHQGRLQWKEAVYFTAQILRALQHAHDNGIVHRDVKPQNIMLLQDGSIKVTDFGIARFARSGMHTMSDKAIGSVHYISPEQARGDAIDNRTDLYSVGVILYEMLTGCLPFEGETAVAVALKHIEEPLRLPREIDPEIPQGLEEIVVRAMQKDAGERYASAAEMLRDMDSFRHDPSIVFGYQYFPAAEQQELYHRGSQQTMGGEDLEQDRRKKRPSNGRRSNQIKRRAAEQNAALGEEMAEQEYGKPKGVLPVLAGVTAAFVVGTIIFIGSMLVLNNPFERVDDVIVPTLVGVNYDSVKDSENYKNFIIQVVSSEYNPSYGNGEIYDQEPSPGRTVKMGSTIKVKVSLGTELVLIPDGLIGKEATAATQDLERLGLTVQRSDVFNEIVPAGQVCATNPGKGSEVPAGSTVQIQVSMGPDAKTTEVPDLGGMNLEDARQALEDANLSVGNITYRASESSTDMVIGQSPGPTSQVSEGSFVDLTLSSGEEDIRSVQIYVKLPEEISNVVTVRAEQDGNPVIERQVQPSLVKVWKPTFSGSGSATVVIYIDNAVYQTYAVDFDEGKSTLQ